MRLFVGVELDEEARAMAARTNARLQETLERTLSAKWIPAENLHLTVRFIGHVADERAPGLLDALSPPLRVAPFDVELRGCGSFPPKGPPRVIWIGVSDGMAGLTALHEEFNRRVLPFGFEPESRPYSAHLTLARVKETPRGSGAVIREAIRTIHVPPIRWSVPAATVFESRLSPKGSTYTALLRVPLLTTRPSA